MLRAALVGMAQGSDLGDLGSPLAAGNIFGILLIVLGLIEVLRGDFVGGMWLALIGLFLRGAASATYEQTLARQILAGQPVSRFMNRRPITVSPELSVRELVEDYVYRHHHKVFPVVRDGRLLGCVTTAQISEVGEDQWDRRTVAEIMEPCSEDNTISPETDALEAMTKMQRTGRSPSPRCGPRPACRDPLTARPARVPHAQAPIRGRARARGRPGSAGLRHLRG